jgi:hypothetical protein
MKTRMMIPLAVALLVATATGAGQGHTYSKAEICTLTTQLAQSIAKARDRGVSKEAQIRYAHSKAQEAGAPRGMEEAALDFIEAAYLDPSITVEQAGRLAFDGCMN